MSQPRKYPDKAPNWKAIERIVADFQRVAERDKQRNPTAGRKDAKR